MFSFRILDLAVEFYEQTKKLSVSGNLGNQLDRAASSIALNLSEGNGKGSAKEKRHFFQTAFASLRECQTIFRLMKLEHDPAVETANKLGGSLYRLVNSKIKPSPNHRNPF